MGIERLVTGETCSIEALLQKLHSLGATSEIIMINGALVAPGAMPPDDWRDVRLKTPAGTVTLTKKHNGISVVVFGNADASLLAVQQQIVTLLQSS